MILYHIQTFPENEFKEGEIITTGKSINRLITGCYRAHASFVYDTQKNEEEKTIMNFRKAFTDYLSLDKFNELTTKQQENFLTELNNYLKKMQIAGREQVLEEYRKKHKRRLPSRFKCIWLTDEISLDTWIKILTETSAYNIYQVETDHDPFVSRNHLLPNSLKPLYEQMKEAEKYWNPTKDDLKDATDKEYLYTGELKILRRIK